MEYSVNYSKTAGSLWQYYKDELAAAIVSSKSFQFKIKITRKPSAAGNTKAVEIAASLKH